MRVVFCLMLLLSVVLAPAAAQEETNEITTERLLEEMVNLTALCEYPDPPFVCRQFSSYDRRSTSPADAEAWFANADAGQFLRVEEVDAGDGEVRNEYVLMDADGPGAVVRIWSANPQGTLRIYLDRKPTPIIAEPMPDLLGGKVPGFPEPLSGMRSAGWNLYFPIAYRRHCKITSDVGGFYYHVNYRTYAPGTRVITYHPLQMESDVLQAQLERVRSVLSHPRAGGRGAPATNVEARDARLRQQRAAWRPLEAGKQLILHEDKGGPGAIRAVRIGVDAAPEHLAQVLRQVLVIAEFDGQRTVLCPLGDFFGAAPGVNPYTSLPMGVMKPNEKSPLILWSHWVMPFEKGCWLVLENRGEHPARIGAAVEQEPFQWNDRSMHFNAQWRISFNVPSRPFVDWNYVDIDGRGVYVGSSMTIANPVRLWWGEGDEKIYIDGERFPSHFGTGTEDYYGYAWCNPATFTHAYHNQPRCDGPGNYGYTSVNRWHILDCIPFERSFKFDMELWHSRADVKVTPSVVAYWYARPGGKSNRPEIKPEDLVLRPMPPYNAPRVPGAIEGESLTILEHTGTLAPQDILPCSGEQHLWWRDAQPGARLVLALPVAEAGRYRVIVQCLTARDYGVTQLYLNGVPAGEPLDLYNDRVAVSGERVLGEFDLEAGDNELTAEIVGTNPQAKPSYMFGLDYVRLEPVTPAPR